MPTSAFPKHCSNCDQVTYNNPFPVAVISVPIKTRGGQIGLLCVKRGVAPEQGIYALPGGYVDDGDESAEAAACRELFEETQIQISPSDVFVTHTERHDDHLLIFTRHRNILDAGDVLKQFTPTAEVTEVSVQTSLVELAFPSHTAVLKQHISSRGAKI